MYSIKSFIKYKLDLPHCINDGHDMKHKRDHRARLDKNLHCGSCSFPHHVNSHVLHQDW